MDHEGSLLRLTAATASEYQEQWALNGSPLLPEKETADYENAPLHTSALTHTFRTDGAPEGQKDLRDPWTESRGE